MERYSTYDQYVGFLNIAYAIAKKGILPATWTKMQTYFKYMNENDVNYPQWYELSCWPDDIKQAGLGALDGWHFYDQPFYDGIKPEDANFTLDPNYGVVNTMVSPSCNRDRTRRGCTSNATTRTACTISR